MDEHEKVIAELSKKIEQLTSQHQLFHQEIVQLQKQVVALEFLRKKANPPVVHTTGITEKEVTELPPAKPTQPLTVTASPLSAKPNTAERPKQKTPIEEFIGTNLLNKVGIIVLVIGIGFGTKYAIDHDLLSPLTRVILGYFSGVVILGFAIKLKKKYESFSAVLLSGGMAALYFVTYAAYDFYALIPQAIAFVLMVLFTAFTAFSAVHYNLQLIAVIGLVGAYAVPFLLSNGSGRVAILFSYMSIINAGILVLAFKKYWKNLYYLAFILTWTIFATWILTDYTYVSHFWISLAFATVFFLIFYATFLSYNLVRQEGLSRWDLILMTLNSFFYYGFGYYTIDSFAEGERYLGLFTVCTALIHFGAVVLIYSKQKDQHKDIFYFIAGMVLVFITIAVPVQLEGNWVTLIWSAEAALLFWIGRSKTYPVYEKISYGLILLAISSLLHDWDSYYQRYSISHDTVQVFHSTLFLNIQFFTSLWVVASLAFIVKTGVAKTTPLSENILTRIFVFMVPSFLGIVLYFAFYKEIQFFWDQRYAASGVLIRGEENVAYTLYDYTLRNFQAVWLINYSAVFGLLLTIVNIKFIKNEILSYTNTGFNTVVVIVFITAGLIELAELRLSFIEQVNSQYYFRGNYYIIIRYLSLLFIVPLLICNYWYCNKTPYFNDISQKAERVLFHAVVLTLLSSELIHWLDMTGVENSFKLSLSILWGAYALFLILTGLLKNQKHIRITGMAFFSMTLIKLFVYDMADMSTIAKTIVMMILGVLLLTASFFYNKYKRINENS
jgi:uncharacterized membrane protein